jgi:secretion/DNA translocation related CpaE-like protein
LSVVHSFGTDRIPAVRPGTLTGMRAHPVIGVLAGCGGAGASVFAAVLAGQIAQHDRHSFLIDCDPAGGGLDVLLGCEQLPGPRWGQVRLAGGTLDPAVLVDSLPRWQQVSVLSADTGQPPDPEPTALVVQAARTAAAVVIDLPRAPSELRRVALRACDLVVLVVVAEVRALTATALVAAGLDQHRTVVLVRGSARSLSPVRIGELLCLPVFGRLPHDPAGTRPGGLRLADVRRRTRRLARAVLQAAYDHRPATSLVGSDAA